MDRRVPKNDLLFWEVCEMDFLNGLADFSVMLSNFDIRLAFPNVYCSERLLLQWKANQLCYYGYKQIVDIFVYNPIFMFKYSKYIFSQTDSTAHLFCEKINNENFF